MLQYEIPIEKQVPMIAQAGFSHVSLGEKEQHSRFLSKEGREQLNILMEKNSVQIDTIHGYSADQKNSVELLSLTAEAAAELNVPVVVIHGGPFTLNQEDFKNKYEILMNNCRKLDLIGKKYEITFALENVCPGPATDLIKHTILDMKSPNIGFCYDSSHDQINGPNPFDLLLELKHRIVAVHLSDRIKEFVDHVIPGEGFIDFNKICQILKDSNYSRPLLLEIMMTHSSEKNPQDFLNKSYSRGCELYDMINHNDVTKIGGQKS